MRVPGRCRCRVLVWFPMCPGNWWLMAAHWWWVAVWVLIRRWSVPWLPASTVRVLSAFGPGGQGAGPASAVGPVLAFARAGGSVSWWCGGGASVPLGARLHKRTRAVVGAADAGLVAFFSSPSSRGTLLACRTAVAAWSAGAGVSAGFSWSLVAFPRHRFLGAIQCWWCLGWGLVLGFGARFLVLINDEKSYKKRTFRSKWPIIMI